MGPQCNRHRLLCRRRPIFPGSFPPSIFGTAELNFCVRNGNRWVLSVIITDCMSKDLRPLMSSKCARKDGDRAYALRVFYKTRLHGSPNKFGDPWGNRTPVTGVRGRCLNRLTNGPHFPTGSSVCWCTIRDSNPGPTD